MVESDCSETEEGDMERLQLSSDSVDTIPPKKRLRVENSEDEVDLPATKRQSSVSEQSRMMKNDNAGTNSNKDNTDGFDVEKERYTLCPENKQTVQEIFQSEPDMDKENKEKRNRKLKQENGNENVLENALNNSSVEISVKDEIIASKDNPFQKPARNTSVISTLENKKIRLGEVEMRIKEEIDEMIDGKEDSEEDGMKEQHAVKRHTANTEVVDGLELSVECASDKDESSSESKDEKNASPRPRTIIIKAEPNESELDCSSDGEKSESQRAFVDTLEIKSEKSEVKRRSSRTSFSKLKVSGSEASQNSNSDEDYSPRTKKKIKKSSPTAKRNIANKYRSVESKRGRGRGMRGSSHKKNVEEHVSDEDEDSSAIEKANKTVKIKDGMEEELSEKESSSKDESDNNSEREESSMKDRRRKRSNAKPQEKQIQALKKYLNIAGVKVKSYNDIWADCKSHAAKVKRLKELLEKNGVSGRPTLEKCKRVREENEKMKEVSELDTSNIISEGRVTRARRNMENIKKTPPDTPPRHREARNTFRRIQTVVDSDSE